MLQERIADIAKFVEPDRVRREVYTDAQIFELEMQRIHETVWIYCGHESQVPKAGDYYTVQIGRQPMLMVRGLGRQGERPLQPLPAPRQPDGRRPARQLRPVLPLLLPCLDVQARRQAALDPDDGVGLRGHAPEQGQAPSSA